jgi:Golgi phosphoprotein 3 (GPP34)
MTECPGQARLPRARYLSVRQRLWLLGHDDRHDLERLVDGRALQIGLMAATLIDLMLGGHIYLDSGWVCRDYRPGEARTTPDPIAAAVRYQITAEHGVPVIDLLRSASADPDEPQPHLYARLYERTVAELVDAGILLERQRTFRRAGYLAADQDDLRAHSGLLKNRLVFYPSERNDLSIDCLCALAWALGLHATLVAAHDHARTECILRGITEGLAAVERPYSVVAAVPYLADCVRGLVGDLASVPF